MATELILIRRLEDRPDLGPMLDAMHGFLESRIDGSGITRYVDTCATYPGCVIPYYSIASGCAIDYDTRAWTNELGYSVLLFDTYDSPAYRRVMRFLGSLERRGTFPDKWDFWPPPGDPYFVWASPDTSVINTSLIFWSLASALSGRGDHGRDEDLRLDDELSGPVVSLAPRAAPLRAASGSVGRARLRAAVDRLLVAGASPAATCDDAQTAPPPPTVDRVGPGAPQASPNAHADARAAGDPGRSTRVGLAIEPWLAGRGVIRLVMPAAGVVSVRVYDVAGRRVRALFDGAADAGTRRLGWDGRDDGGRACPGGVYFVAAIAGGRTATARVVVSR
jgi:hypothetical protein